MTDRELLEAAAKAAGIPLAWGEFGSECPVIADDDSSRAWSDWDPLGEDGDALRLAVKLGIDVYRYGPPRFPQARVDAAHMDGVELGQASEPIWSDPYAATRRAIVRAAAAMVKA